MKEKTSAKVFLLILIVAAITWLGAIDIRALQGSTLLEFGTLNFLPHIDFIVEFNTYKLIGLTSIILDFSYLVVFICAILYLRSTHYRFKEQGWLMMSALLFFIFSPAEFYTIWLDWKFIGVVFWWNGDVTYLRTLFVERIMALRGVPVIALLSYYTIIGFAVWKPLVRPIEEKPAEEEDMDE